MRKWASWKHWFRVGHPSKMEPLEPKSSKMEVFKNQWKNKRKFDWFSSPFGATFFIFSYLFHSCSCKNMHFAWDIPQKLASLIFFRFFTFAWQKHENWALACMPGPKWDFRLFEKINILHASKSENWALACTRAPFLRSLKHARKAWKKVSIFEKLTFTV